ncbi:hypothetical protein BC826DRAFT_1146674 [Russula brevipes]|nr:hypothetical protein BC826DRAFT_1146674 [Russula brevipes]
MPSEVETYITSGLDGHRKVGGCADAVVSEIAGVARNLRHNRSVMPVLLAVVDRRIICEVHNYRERNSGCWLLEILYGPGIITKPAKHRIQCVRGWDRDSRPPIDGSRSRVATPLQCQCGDRLPYEFKLGKSKQLSGFFIKILHRHADSRKCPPLKKPTGGLQLLLGPWCSGAEKAPLQGRQGASQRRAAAE